MTIGTLRSGFLLFAIACLPALANSSAAQPLFTRLGPEFSVNSTVFLSQVAPSVAALSNNQFVVAWEDQSGAAPDASGTAVRARRFAHTGNPLAPDFVVNASKAQNQRQPDVARIANGRFVVAWSDNSATGPDKSGYAVRAQRFTNAGGRLGGQINANQLSAGDQDEPAVAALTGGGFVAAYESAASPEAIRGRRFTAGGLPAGAEFNANTTTGSLSRPDAAGLLAGSLVVAWTGLGPETGGSRGSRDIMAQRYSAQGTRIGGQINVSGPRERTQDHAAVAFLGEGKYVVVWDDDSEVGLDQLGLAIRGQILLTSGPKTGPQFLIPTRRDFDQHQPAVASFPNGRFIVVWTDESGSPDDTSGGAIRAQLYSRAGAKVGGEFRVNARTQGDQTQPAVATFNNTDFVVVWSDLSFGQPPDQSGTGIRGQVFRLNR